MPYVNRDASGRVSARFTCLQPGLAEEWLSDDHPDLVQPAIDDAKALKIADIDAAAAEAIAPITSVYSQAERDTWPIQEAEAVAWTADNLAPTPMLTALAAARGEAIADVVANVMAKAAAFKILAGATFGKRKAKIDLVNAATTAEAVAAITW